MVRMMSFLLCYRGDGVDGDGGGGGSMDAWLLWVYGVVLKRLDLTQQAVEVLSEAVHREPLHWGAWLELAALITDREMVGVGQGWEGELMVCVMSVCM